jgi:prephenate dehydrogenase
MSAQADHVPGFVPTLAIIGVGLIGGSFALALRQAGAVGRVLGVGRRAQTLQQAQARGIIDEVVSLSQAAARADLILLATPVGTFGDIFRALKPSLSTHARITDGGSTKANVVAAARAHLGNRIGQFVPAHPIAGSHESGPEAAFADLYRGRDVVVCPLPENSEADVTYVQEAWARCGAKLVRLGVQEHDAVMASVSHFPHWLASLYVEQVSKGAHSQASLQLAGAGFGDFSRIAQGSVEMWRDIFVANRSAMLEQIDAFSELLETARAALQNDDQLWLDQTLRHAAQVRRAWGRGEFRRGMDNENP